MVTRLNRRPGLMVTLIACVGLAISSRTVHAATAPSVDPQQAKQQAVADASATGRMLVLKGAMVGGLLGVMAQLGIALLFASDSSSSTATGKDGSRSDAERRNGPRRVRRGGHPSRKRSRSEHGVAAHAASPINISVHTYPQYPVAGVQQGGMPWGAETPTAAAPVGRGNSVTSGPVGNDAMNAEAVKVWSNAYDQRPLPAVVVNGTSVDYRSPAAFATGDEEAQSGLEMGFERVHRRPDRPGAKSAPEPGRESGSPGMMEQIIAQNLALRA